MSLFASKSTRSVIQRVGWTLSKQNYCSAEGGGSGREKVFFQFRNEIFLLLSVRYVLERAHIRGLR